jgi:uncharacterized protein (TIGR03663 family)
MLIRWLPILILAVFRFWDLGARPVHHDEAVNGWFVDGILSRGYYIYDPQNYHGPFFFYVLTLFEKLFGRSVEVLRVTTVLAGIGVVFSPLLFRKWIGQRAAWITAFLFAVSPAMIFYSRYAIHEMYFVLALILFFVNWLRVREEGFHLRTVLGFGLSFGLLAGVKENFVLYGGCLGLAEILLFFLERKWPLPLDRKFWAGLLGGFAIGFVFIVLCFTAFFLEPEGMEKFFRAFTLWFETGSNGNGHQKPFTYWISLMSSYEWPVLAGLLVSPVFIWKGSPALRLLGLLSVFHALVYSVVSYKTPWCLLSFSWGFVLLLGVWLSERFHSERWKPVVVLALTVFGIHGSVEARDVAWSKPDQDGHPYIYGQTYHEMVDVTKILLEAAEERPGLKESLKIQVVSAFTWPLPYLLGPFRQVAYYGHDNAPPVLNGDWVIFDSNFEPQMGPRLQGDYTRIEARSRQWAYPLLFFKKKAD